MKKLLRVLAAAVLSLGLTGGAVLAQVGTLETTGPESTNTIDFENENEVTVENTADVDLSNDNSQDAESGEAEVDKNTTGGDAMTGDAANDNEFVVDGMIDNSGANSAALEGNNCGCEGEASITETGPHSENSVTFNNSNTVEVTNDTTLNISNNNSQTATSGDAAVTTNTTGGDAQTGDATNTNHVSISFSVKN